MVTVTIHIPSTYSLANSSLADRFFLFFVTKSLCKNHDANLPGIGKEGRNLCLHCFQQLRSHCDKIETRNWEEIPYSSQTVPTDLSVERSKIDSPRPSTTLHSYI